MSAVDRSPVLDRPLAELTDDDISQLTREDCRRFLKQKGMRRPSWNKAQAMQQAISLKALLEGRPGAGDTPVPSVVLSRRHKPRDRRASHNHNETSHDADWPQPPPASSSYRRRDPTTPAMFAATRSPFGVPLADGGPTSPENGRLPRRSTEEPAALGLQLTIFYDGKVSVYDAVPPGKAQAIMQLASNPNCYDSGSAYSAVPQVRPPPPPPPPHFGQLINPSGAARALQLQTSQRDSQDERRATLGTEHDGPTNRKASLQRYLEKKKDRFKGKRTGPGAPSANEKPNRSSDTSTNTTQPRPPCMHGHKLQLSGE